VSFEGDFKVKLGSSFGIGLYAWR